MGDLRVGVVWVCILIFVWLRGKIRVGEWCCEIVGSCEVQIPSFLQPDKYLCVCVYVCVCVCVYRWSVVRVIQASMRSAVW